MNFVRALFARHIPHDPVLWEILLCALLLRLAGIHYGLPLTVVGDEPPFILAALQMIQLHTVIPALHLDAFRSVLYYPPYISYIYLLPFIVMLAVQWFSWHGASALFASHVLSDLSPYFLIARSINVALATFSIYLLYRIAETLLNSRAAARIAAFLLATSIIDMSLSMVARQWLPVSFVFLLVFFTLSRESISASKKLFFSFFIAGVGMGVSTVCALTLVPAFLWFLIEERHRWKVFAREPRAWAGPLIFIALAPLPTLLFPAGQGFLHDITLGTSKNALDFFLSPVHALAQIFPTEPILAGFFLIGLVVLWFENKKWCLLIIGFFISYSCIFYLFFRLEPRFTVPLVPLYALCASAIYARIRGRPLMLSLFLLLFFVPVCASIRFAYLAHADDTRAQARAWVLSHARAGQKVLTYAELTRVPTNASGIEALRAIDPSAVRKTDEADEVLNASNTPAALNLYTVTDDSFFGTLPSYATAHGYAYLLVEPALAAQTPQRAAAFAALESQGTLRARFSGLGDGDSIANSSFRLPLLELFSPKLLGPTVEVYSIR